MLLNSFFAKEYIGAPTEPTRFCRNADFVYMLLPCPAFAKVSERTLRALRLSRRADIPAEINQPMTEIARTLGRENGSQVFFNLVRLLVIRQPQPSAYSYAVGVGDYCRLVVDIPHDKVGGLSAYAGELYKLL